MNDLFDASYFDVVVLSRDFTALDDVVIDGLKLLVALMTWKLIKQELVLFCLSSSSDIFSAYAFGVFGYGSGN